MRKKAIAVVGLTLAAALVSGLAAPQAATANILVRDEGEWVVVRTTLKGAHGVLRRVRRDSVEAKKAFWFERLQAQRRERGVSKTRGLKGAR